MSPATMDGTARVPAALQSSSSSSLPPLLWLLPPPFLRLHRLELPMLVASAVEVVEEEELVRVDAARRVAEAEVVAKAVERAEVEDEDEDPEEPVRQRPSDVQVWPALQ